MSSDYDHNSIAVDAACSGNPGTMYYRGVIAATKEIVFAQGPFPSATNNIGEFLAIVHALALLYKAKDTRVIYSDSGATAGRRIGDTLTETVNKEVEKVVTRPNTVTLPSGTKTNIVVQIDIKLPKYERVR